MAAPQTSRIQAFILEYLKDRNATQAAIRVGYSARSAKQMASRALLRPEVQAILAAEEAKLQKQMGVTVESIANELEDARKLAEKIEQPAAMVAASLGKAKLFGLIVEKKEHRIADARPATMADLVGFAAEVASGEGETAGDGVLH